MRGASKGHAFWEKTAGTQSYGKIKLCMFASLLIIKIIIL
jgi:hypothetical protein